MPKKFLEFILAGIFCCDAFIQGEIGQCCEKKWGDIKPKYYAEQKIPIENYLVTIKTQDNEPDGLVDRVFLDYVSNDKRTIFNSPVPRYVSSKSEQGYLPEFTRIMNSEQREIFSKLHNFGETNGVENLIGIEILQPLHKEEKPKKKGLALILEKVNPYNYGAKLVEVMKKYF